MRWILPLAAALLIAAPAPAQNPPPGPRVTLNLTATPARHAFELLFTGSARSFNLDGRVPNTPVTLKLRDVEFDAALDELCRAMSTPGTRVLARRDRDIYHITVADEPAEKTTLEKIPIQFQPVQQLMAQFDPKLVPAGIVVMTPMVGDNSLIVRGTPDGIMALKNLIRLNDIPLRQLSLKIGVTGPGADGKPLNIQSMARTINGKETVIDEQATVAGRQARVLVRLKPLVSGDATLLIESEWDLSLPIAGGARGPIRLVKRLTATTRTLPGLGTVVGEVDISTWGGKGSVRLWVRPDLLPHPSGRTVEGPEGEAVGTVSLLKDRPYLSAHDLAALLFNRERGLAGRAEFDAQNRCFVLRGGAPAGLSESPPAVGHSGPYPLLIDGRTISRGVRLAAVRLWGSQITPDLGGHPYFPLDDLVRVLGGRLEFDPIADTYRMVGGRPLRALLGGEQAGRQDR